VLFQDFQVSVDAAEKALGRRLRGDPCRGERAVLAALNRGRLGQARHQLDGDVGADFRVLVLERWRGAELRLEGARVFRVRLRRDVWTFYAREAWKTGTSLAESLSSAIERDFKDLS
jgi:hypothetical protein